MAKRSASVAFAVSTKTNKVEGREKSPVSTTFFPPPMKKLNGKLLGEEAINAISPPALDPIDFIVLSRINDSSYEKRIQTSLHPWHHENKMITNPAIPRDIDELYSGSVLQDIHHFLKDLDDGFSSWGETASCPFFIYLYNSKMMHAHLGLLQHNGVRNNNYAKKSLISWYKCNLCSNPHVQYRSHDNNMHGKLNHYGYNNGIKKEHSVTPFNRTVNDDVGGFVCHKESHNEKVTLNMSNIDYQETNFCAADKASITNDQSRMKQDLRHAKKMNSLPALDPFDYVVLSRIDDSSCEKYVQTSLYPWHHENKMITNPAIPRDIDEFYSEIILHHFDNKDEDIKRFFNNHNDVLYSLGDTSCPYFVGLCNSKIMHDGMSLLSHHGRRNHVYAKKNSISRYTCPLCPNKPGVLCLNTQVGSNEHYSGKSLLKHFIINETEESSGINEKEKCKMGGVIIARKTPNENSDPKKASCAVAASVPTHLLRKKLHKKITEEVPTKSTPKQIWKPLVFDKKDSRPLKVIISEVETKLKSLETTIRSRRRYTYAIMSSSNSKRINDDDEVEEQNYLSEMKSFAKGLRERVRKLENERREWQSYNAEQEFFHWRSAHSYKTTWRKKRTKEEIERIAFEKRPIRLLSDNEWSSFAAEGGECNSKDCRLCDGGFTRAIMTNLEIETAGGNLKRVCQGMIGSTNVSILKPFVSVLSPNVKRKDEECSSEQIFTNDVAASNESLNFHRSAGIQLRHRSSRGKNKEREEWIRLRNLKYKAHFIQNYNKGLLGKVKEPCMGRQTLESRPFGKGE